MKAKFLFWGAIIFFILGQHTQDNRLYYFFAVYFAMLFIGVLFYKLEYRPQPSEDRIEKLPKSNSSAGK